MTKEKESRVFAFWLTKKKYSANHLKENEQQKNSLF